MIEITLTKKLKGKELVKEMEKEYGSIDRLQRKLERGEGNMKLQLDFEDWEYFIKCPDEEIERTTTKFTESLNMGMAEIELINFIKNNHPKSMSELAKLTNKDVSNVQRRVKKLEKEGLITLEEGNKNSKKPIVNYDKIEIAV